MSEAGMCHKKVKLNRQIVLYLTIASPETLDVFNSFQSTEADAKLQNYFIEIRTLLHSIRK